MEILKNLKQIYDKLDALFELNNETNLEGDNFLLEIKNKSYLDNLSTKIQNAELQEKNELELLELIFQLKDYTASVCNLTYLFLLTKKYKELYVLISKLFVSHIGQIYYSSTKTNAISKNFDRLVEVVKTANIPNEIFIEFLLFLQKNNNPTYFDNWKLPALEYLQTQYLENEKWFVDFLQKNSSLKYSLFSAITTFNKAKGIDFLVDDFVNNPQCDIKQNIAIIKNYKREALHFIDSIFPKSTLTTQTKLTKLLLEMSSDSEVMTRIQDIYSTTNHHEITEIIAEQLGISDTMNIHTEKQFLYAARRKIKEPQERSLGMPFSKFNLKTTSGIPADNTVYSFLIFLFKEEKHFQNLYKLKVLEEIFDKESLQNFAISLFTTLSRKTDILQAKWCVRMFALLTPSSKADWIFNFLKTLINQNRKKEAMYLITALIYSKKSEVIDFLRIFLEDNNLFIHENLDNFVKQISICLKLHEEDIKDMLVPNQFSLGEFDIQRDRLYNAFIAGKMYEPNIFDKLFICNKIYNKLAQNLVFGEYRFGNLYNAFIIVDDQKEFIVGQTIFESDEEKNTDITIGIIHPLDCDLKFEKITTYFTNPTFDQFKPARFNSTENPLSITTINKFFGVMINPQKFLNFIFSKGFKPNKNQDESEFKTVIHSFPALNLICELEFEKPMKEDITYNSLGSVCFYKISDTMESEGKFLTQKANALAAASIPTRYYNHVLTIIFEGSKM